MIDKTSTSKSLKKNVGGVPDPAFPTNTIRTVTNRLGVVEDLTKTDIPFASDYNKLLPLMKSIFTTLITYIKQYIQNQLDNRYISYQTFMLDADVTLSSYGSSLNLWDAWDEPTTEYITYSNTNQTFKNNTVNVLKVKINFIGLLDNLVNGTVSIWLNTIASEAPQDYNAIFQSVDAAGRNTNNSFSITLIMEPQDSFRLVALTSSTSTVKLLRVPSGSVYVVPGTKLELESQIYYQ